MKVRSLVAAVAISAFTLPAFAKDIVQTAQDNGSFNVSGWQSHIASPSR